MENEQRSQQQQQAMQTPIQITLTLAEINGVLMAMQEAPYKLSKPLIDKIAEQANDFVRRMEPRPQPQAQTPQIPINLGSTNTPLS